jgi:hypothetical protein
MNAHSVNPRIQNEVRDEYYERNESKRLKPKSDSGMKAEINVNEKTEDRR